MRLIIYLLLGQCIQFSFGTPIVGRNVLEARKRQFPSLVSLMHINTRSQVIENNQFCTGVLISKAHVLTAAHCLSNVLVNETEIIAGSIDLRCGKKHKISWWVTYNQWIERRNELLEFQINDIAVIKLTEYISKQIRPATLSNAPNTYLYGMNVVTAGWGITNTEENPRLLHTVGLKIISNEDCANKIESLHGSQIPIHYRFLCSISDPYALLLFGDSGAPIFYMGTIIAIHKSTAPKLEGHFHPQKVNVHTSIEYYKRFILNVINSNEEWI